MSEPAQRTPYFPADGGSGDAHGAELDQVLAARGLTGGSPIIGMIWAQTGEGVIGRGGGMPWHLPEDLLHFKNTTAGHPVIMGRRTWESFPAAYRPLPGRTNIIVSSSPTLAQELEPAGAVVVPSLEEALDRARTSPGGDMIWIVGGAQLYEAAVPRADAAVVTVIDTNAEGDTYAPRLGPEWAFAGVNPARGWNTAANGTRYRIALWTRGRMAGRDVTDQADVADLP